MSNFDQRDQKVENQVNAGVIEKFFQSLNIDYPIEKILFAELIATIVIQSLIHLFGIFSFFDPMLLFCYAPLCLCSPLTFGLNAIYAFMIGFAKKDGKLIVLSVISGALAMVPTFFYLVYRVFQR